jgi:hypothetical protein
LGVAYAKELILGSFLCEKMGVVGQGFELLKDGCINTIVDMKGLNEILKLHM